MKRWIQDINKYAKENVLKFLIGNKSDLVNERQVNYGEARTFASQMHITYFNLSAKKNENINEFFEAATKIFLLKFNFFEEENQKVILNDRKQTKESKKKGKKKDEMQIKILFFLI